MDTNLRDATATIDGIFMHRQGPGGLVMRAFVRDGRAHFEGGKSTHSVSYDGPDDAERVLIHWEGYCDAYGCGMALGTAVTFTASNLSRRCTIVAAPGAGSATILVSGFKYKGSGRLSRPRRVRKCDVRVVAPPTTSKRVS